MKNSHLRKLAFSVILAMLTFSGQAYAAGDLYILNWTDYTSPDVIKKFSNETGIAVHLDTIDSNETMLAKLRSSATGYDIVMISSDFVPIFAGEGLLSTIDAPHLVGYDNIEPRWRKPAWDPQNLYTVPYHWGVTSFSVNTKHIAGPWDSLKLLFEPPPEAKGKIGMLGSPSEVIALAQVYLGMKTCETDASNMKKVANLLEAQAPFVKVYNSDGIIDRMGTGETWMHLGWNGDAARARANNPDVKFVFAKEGAIGWMGNIAVPASSKNPENAKRFLEFMLKPENSGLSANFTRYGSAIKGASEYFDAELKSAPEMKVPDDLKLTFVPACPAAATKLMDRVWTKLKR